jgi:Raf kinase inhibitor-like YbhB/YbcL family protein
MAATGFAAVRCANIHLRIMIAAILCAALSGSAAPLKGGSPMTLSVSSPAFESMRAIPSQYTCDGSDISPPLCWKGVPPAAKSIVLFCDDPDAPRGTWVHWVCYDIPPTVDTLRENVPKTDTLPAGGNQGLSDFGRIGYGGPCPPGGTHRYFFKVYALDAMLNLRPGRTKKEVEQAMQGHVLALGECVGTYSRKR